MMTVYKYPLAVKDSQYLQLPRGYELLSAADQAGELVLWARVDTDQPTVPCQVLIFGTGHPCELPKHRPYRFINTVQQAALVWHIWAAI